MGHLYILLEICYMNIYMDNLHSRNLDNLHNNLGSHQDGHMDSQRVIEDMLGKDKLHYQHRKEVSICSMVMLFSMMDPYSK